MMDRVDDNITWEQFKQAIDAQLKELNIDGSKVTVDYVDWSPGWVIEPPTVSYDEVEGAVSIS